MVMKIGVKIYPTYKEYYQKIKKYIDFVEVVAIEGENYSFLLKIDLPIVLHAEDFKYLTNLANPGNNSMSEKYLKFVFDLLKTHKAHHVVLNPGIRFNNKCTTENHVDLIKKYSTKKILFENQPALKNRTYPFYARNYDEVRQFLKLTSAGLCMDFDHAFASAFFFNRDPVDFCKDMLDLKPEHIHISNGKNHSHLDAHLHFDEGDFNMVQMKELIPQDRDVLVTLDTANDFKKQIEEIKFLREPEFVRK